MCSDNSQRFKEHVCGLNMASDTRAGGGCASGHMLKRNACLDDLTTLKHLNKHIIQ